MTEWLRGLAIKNNYPTLMEVIEDTITNWRYYPITDGEIDWDLYYDVRKSDGVPEYDELLKEFGVTLPANLCLLDANPIDYFDLLRLWAVKHDKNYEELVAKIRKPA